MTRANFDFSILSGLIFPCSKPGGVMWSMPLGYSNHFNENFRGESNPFPRFDAQQIEPLLERGRC